MTIAAPRLEACYFAHGQGDRWPRLARVLDASARQHCPSWRVHVQAVTITVPERGSRSQATNTAKLEQWNRIVQAADDGDRLLLVDADTFVTRPLDDLWSQSFDVAYTVRPMWLPLNAGVIALRVSPAVRAFVQAWTDENARLFEAVYRDVGTARDWRRQYGGINQAALAHVLKDAQLVQALALPCREWNCEDTTWATFDPAVTRIVHVKSALRMACLESQPIPPALADLAQRWRALDRQTRLARSA